MNPASNSVRRLHGERGAVLVVTTIMLLVLTILALSFVSRHRTETTIATNAADRQVAFQTAEGALSQVETDILAGNYPTSSFTPGAAGLFRFDETINARWRTVDWSSAAVLQSFQGNSSQKAAYIIELLPSFAKPGQDLGKVKQINVYRITVRAVGASGGAPVMLQSIVQVPQ